ncbi:hypothetical protein DEU56DRAFT_785701 [Suillus clintonianus]|uniref:uncharacterized protein n=1 Tax=Suillus clintonianus TaxID=1904413 RepID=UPI001B877B57|nr:uncharacterized protein DEU56DRAFT_785701 [Suillus clintonianus]KAG2146660.1 hypothetical protein DEU56DRAFT_785701 [Suillus clintonianus]
MAQCLYISEIQLSVFYWIFVLDTSRGKHVSQATLAALARTCRTFHDVALDVLWQQFGTIARAIQCMPHDLWGGDSSRSQSGCIHLKLHRNLTKDDWNIFHKYALRIRHISLANQDIRRRKTLMVDIDDELLVSLASMDPIQPLLPNLTYLEWLIYDEGDLRLISRIMTKSLTSLFLEVWAISPLPSLQQFISSIAPACPSLRQLTVHSVALSNHLRDSVSQTLCHLPHLTTLHCGVLDAQVLDHLSRLPSLVELKFALQPNIEFQNELPFQHLQVLGVHAQNITSAVDLVSRMRNNLTNLSICSDDHTGTFVLAQLFRRLSTSVNHYSLRHLHIMVAERPPHRMFDSIPVMKLEELHPLLSFKRLTHVHLDVGCGISLDDVAALELAQAWPDIVHLVLNKFLDNPLPSSMTPIGLMCFLKHCPNLTELTLEIDFSLVEEQDDQSWVGDVTHQHLSTLDVTYSKIHDAAKVAAFLAGVIPRTAHIRYSWIHALDDQREYAEKWHEASKLLHAEEEEQLLITC